jgi:hypothetical protein
MEISSTGHMLVADVLALPPFNSHRSRRSCQPRLRRCRAECRTARVSHRSEPPRVCTRAPAFRGTGIYAVRHIRGSSGERPTVAGGAWPVILLLAVLLFASRVKACA